MKNINKNQKFEDQSHTNHHLLWYQGLTDKIQSSCLLSIFVFDLPSPGFQNITEFNGSFLHVNIS